MLALLLAITSVSGRNTHTHTSSIIYCTLRKRENAVNITQIAYFSCPFDSNLKKNDEPQMKKTTDLIYS